MQINLKFGIIFGILAVSGQAATISLQADFSISNGNPNGQWKYTEGATPSTGALLTLQTPQNNGNPLYPALSNGYWGTGSDLNTNTPDLLKAQVNGSSAGGTDNDFLTGDIVGHSPNAGDWLFVTWTAPTAGSVGAQSGSVWYAHSSVTRTNNWAYFENNTSVASGTVTNGEDRNHPDTFSAGSLSVSAGDTFSLGIQRVSEFGSLAGMSLSFEFTPDVSTVPEPGTFLGILGGLATLAFARRSFNA